MPQPRIRILCVDDHRIVREGIALIINSQRDMEVIATVATGEEALAMFRQHHPDITLMDLRLRTMSGLEAIRAIRREDPEARIIVLTMYEGDEDIRRALKAGASAYLLKDTLPQDLIGVVRDVYAGRVPTVPDIEARLQESASAPALTQREVEVLELVAEGKRNKEIAARLAVGEETVHMHLKNIYAKLKVSDRGAAVNVALRRGIVHIE